MDQPFVVCHMLSSLDGKIDGDFFALPEVGPALQAYGGIRSKFYHCQAIVYGATTAAGFAAGPMTQLPEADAHLPMGDYLAQPSEQDYTVVLVPQGSPSPTSSSRSPKPHPTATCPICGRCASPTCWPGRNSLMSLAWC